MSVAESYYICSGLEADSAVSVRVRAVNGAGLGDLATINTSTACQSKGPSIYMFCVGSFILLWILRSARL